jgi:catechol 2,3-dioxygenase-like lactoylglutathione lyase family enzyme
MFEFKSAFSGFAVDDIERARDFYEGDLGLRVTTEMGGMLLNLQLPGDRDTMVYSKPDFEPATYTVLNFQVEDIDAAVDQLASVGIEMELFEGFDQDDDGIARGPEGPPIAWFRDPAGNILSVLEG